MDDMLEESDDADNLNNLIVHKFSWCSEGTSRSPYLTFFSYYFVRLAHSNSRHMHLNVFRVTLFTCTDKQTSC